ncbi:MAG: isoprenyl transferase, partial [Cyclobacteriaceae bacterium]|nr:isoprenyl transferase [Cyclobacteriaceae bacterium]
MTQSTQESNRIIPRHVAVIMDGNGRWAKKKGAARIFGHRNAITAVRETTEFCGENGVGYLTLFAFSTENWGRPKFEVEGLMSLLVSTINDELPTLQKNNVQLHSIGDRSQLPSDTKAKLEQAIEDTAANTGLKLILALNYSGRWDITNAIKNIATDIQQGKLTATDISQDVVDQYLSTNGFPDPELLVRTSGEMRISNFLLWQSAYTELFFTEVLWPDFRKEHMIEALR